jgi:hypothetical protein
MLEQHKTCSERMNGINVPVDTVHWWAVARNYILYFIIVRIRAESAAFQNGHYFLLIIGELVD